MPNNKRLAMLSVNEAEDIARELEASLQAHRRWFRTFQMGLVCRTQPDPDDLAADAHERSEFGKLYYGRTHPHLSNHAGYSDAGVQHHEIHEMARHFAKIVAGGGEVSPGQYQKFIASVERFETGLGTLLAEAIEVIRYTDPLTGIANRFAMMPRLEQERERLKRSGQPACIAMMDLDRFKNVNDTLGHMAGDKVLRDVATYMLKHMRQYDLIYRYGGEEFTLLLPNTTPEEARQVLDRLRVGLAKRETLIDDHSVQITASFGIAGLSSDLPVTDTIDLADKALYRAKKSGRNCVRVWSGEGPGGNGGPGTDSGENRVITGIAS